jgi:phage recombination protein Bet
MAQEIQKDTGKINTLVPVRYSYEGREITLTFDDVKALICRDQRHTPSNAEVVFFMQFCRHMEANPFIMDAYLIKYAANKSASNVLGVGFFMSRASVDPRYKGFEEGLIVKDKAGRIVDRLGEFRLDDDEVLGGWCKVYVEGYSVPIEKRPLLSRYQKKRLDEKSGKYVPQAQWKDNPEMMVVKVARAQAHRSALPHRMRGAYIREEIEHYAEREDVPQLEAAPSEITPEQEKAYLSEIAGDVRVIDPELEFKDDDFEAYMRSVADAQGVEVSQTCVSFRQNVNNEANFARFRDHFKRWIDRRADVEEMPERTPLNEISSEELASPEPPEGGPETEDDLPLDKAERPKWLTYNKEQFENLVGETTEDEWKGWHSDHKKQFMAKHDKMGLPWPPPHWIAGYDVVAEEAPDDGPTVDDVVERLKKAIGPNEGETLDRIDLYVRHFRAKGVDDDNLASMLTDMTEAPRPDHEIDKWWAFLPKEDKNRLTDGRLL